MDRFLALPLAILIAYAASASGQGGPEIVCTNVVSIDLGNNNFYDPDVLDGTSSSTQTDGKFYINGDELDYSAYDALDFRCKGELFTSTMPRFVAEFDLGMCDPYVSANSTYINYEYKIWNKPMLWENSNPAIARYEVHSYRFDCIYTRLMTDETTTNWIVPRIVETHVWDGTSMYEGTFTFSLDFMDSTYTTPAADGDVVDVNDWMYIALTLETGSADTNNFVAFKDCFAKELSSSETMTYQLIQDYAVNDETWDQDGSIVMEASGSSQQAQLKVKAFIWNDASTPSTTRIYVQCDATVCNDDVTSNCVNYVSDASYAHTNRRRRRRRDTGSQQVVTLMAGPMEVM